MPPTDNWALTMFSFTTELVRGEHTPAELLTAAYEAGLAARFEVDGFQHFATFPDVSDEEAESFRWTVEHLGIALTAVGIYDDFYLDPRRRADLPERVAYLERQIESAGRLGFPVAKIAWGVDPAVLDALRPSLERAGVRLCQEAQGALRPDSPELTRQIAFADEHPDLFGFVFDLSACMYGLPASYLEDLRRLAVPERALLLIEEEWPLGAEDTLRERVFAATGGHVLSADARLRLQMPFGRFGNSRVEQFRDFIPYADIVHLKYWDLDDTGGIVSGPVADLHAELERAGFDGPVTSEWGGHEWLDGDGYDAMTMTSGHRVLYETAVAAVAASAVPRSRSLPASSPSTEIGSA